jgi:hypothetical protein
MLVTLDVQTLERVVERLHGVLERQAMFAPVRFRLARVPFEPDVAGPSSALLV